MCENAFCDTRSREIAMRRALRFLLRGLIVVVVLVIALLGYFVYTPSPEVPRLSGKLTKGTIEVADERART